MSMGGGGGFRGGGGGGGFRGGGGGRRSDLALKHDVVLLGRLDNGLGYYRFSYLGSNKAYVGVIAQEVRRVMPEAVERGADGYLRSITRSSEFPSTAMKNGSRPARAFPNRRGCSHGIMSLVS